MLEKFETVYRNFIDFCAIASVAVPFLSWLYRKYIREKISGWSENSATKEIIRLAIQSYLLTAMYGNSKIMTMEMSSLIIRTVFSCSLMIVGYVFTGITVIEIDYLSSSKIMTSEIVSIGWSDLLIPQSQYGHIILIILISVLAMFGTIGGFRRLSRNLQWLRNVRNPRKFSMQAKVRVDALIRKVEKNRDLALSAKSFIDNVNQIQSWSENIDPIPIPLEVRNFSEKHRIR